MSAALPQGGGIEPTSLDIVCYVSAPNLVNTACDHVGELRRLFVGGEDALSATPLSCPVSHSLRQHRLAAFIAQFEPSTGNAKHYKEVTSWPRIKWHEVEALACRGPSTQGGIVLLTQLFYELASFYGRPSGEQPFEPDTQALSAVEAYNLRFASKYHAVESDPFALPLRRLHPSVRQVLQHLAALRVAFPASELPAPLPAPLLQYTLDGNTVRLGQHCRCNAEEFAELCTLWVASGQAAQVLHLLQDAPSHCNWIASILT